MTQTAVLWLQQALTTHLTDYQITSFEGLFQQALDMEKKQIIEAYQAGNGETNNEYVLYATNYWAEEYYYDHFVDGNKKEYTPPHTPGHTPPHIGYNES